MPDQRVEEYRGRDGQWHASSLRGRWPWAILVRPDDVVQAVRSIGTVISESYFLGTAKHETNWCLNERDTEPPKPDGTRVVTWGLYQIEQEEARDVGLRDANLLELEGATRVMIRLAEWRRALIRSHVRLTDHDPDPIALEAYLAIAHNMGIGTALTSIRIHGLDWGGPDGFRARNPSMEFVQSGYGDDVLPTPPTEPRVA